MKLKRRLARGVLAVSLAACCAPTAAHAALARIAFSTAHGIYAIRADGSDRRQLAGRLTAMPAWSPDGQRIAFVRELPHNRSQIWTMRADGSDRGPLTSTPPRGVQEGTPAWSPDGRFVAFARLSRQSSLVVVGADDRGERTLASEKGVLRWFANPAWAPDGKRLLYTQVRLGADAYFQSSLWVIGVDGSGGHLIAAEAGPASWSPDGSRIAAVVTRDHNGHSCGEDECSWNGEIYVMNADGSGGTRLTNNAGDDQGPMWSGDGSRLVFASNRNYPDGEDSYELYSMRPDGTCLTWLTNGTPGSAEPVWQPGASLSTDPGGCGPLMRPPLVETKVPKPSHPRGATTYWLGKTTPGGLLLTDMSQEYYSYDDCGMFDPGACPPTVDIGNQSVCARHSLLLYGLHASGLSVVRGALLYKTRTPDLLIDLYTGTTRVELQTDASAVPNVIAQLRRAGSSGGPSGNLPKPRLPDTLWRKLHGTRAGRRVERRLHQLGVTGRVRCPRRSRH